MWTKKQIRERKEGRQTLKREGIKESNEKIEIIMKERKNNKKGSKKVGGKERRKEGKDKIKEKKRKGE